MSTAEDLARMDSVNAQLSRELSTAYTTAMFSIWPDEAARRAVQGRLSDISVKLGELRGRLRDEVMAGTLDSWRWFAIADTQHRALMDVVQTSESEAGLWNITRNYFGEVRNSVIGVVEEVKEAAQGAKDASEAFAAALPYLLVIVSAGIIGYLVLRVVILIRAARGG